jgi:predicted permease
MLKRMSVWLVAILIYIVGFVFYDFDLLSAKSLTLLAKIVFWISLPTFLVHQWMINRKQRNALIQPDADK